MPGYDPVDVVLGLSGVYGAGRALVGRAGAGEIRVVLPERAYNLGATATRISVEDKLARYLLNTSHLIGGSKAKWFDSALGFNSRNADQLAKQIVFNEASVVRTAVIEQGVKFNQVISITGANGRVIDVTFGWIRNSDGVVRLTTGIPTKK